MFHHYISDETISVMKQLFQIDTLEGKTVVSGYVVGNNHVMKTLVLEKPGSEGLPWLIPGVAVLFAPSCLRAIPGRRNERSDYQ
jgi:hypothetical protein